MRYIITDTNHNPDGYLPYHIPRAWYSDCEITQSAHHLLPIPQVLIEEHGHIQLPHSNIQLLYTQYLDTRSDRYETHIESEPTPEHLQAKSIQYHTDSVIGIIQATNHYLKHHGDTAMKYIPDTHRDGSYIETYTRPSKPKAAEYLYNLLTDDLPGGFNGYAEVSALRDTFLEHYNYHRATYYRARRRLEDLGLIEIDTTWDSVRVVSEIDTEHTRRVKTAIRDLVSDDEEQTKAAARAEREQRESSTPDSATPRDHKPCEDSNIDTITRLQAYAIRAGLYLAENSAHLHERNQKYYYHQAIDDLREQHPRDRINIHIDIAAAATLSIIHVFNDGRITPGQAWTDDTYGDYESWSHIDSMTLTEIAEIPDKLNHYRRNTDSIRDHAPCEDSRDTRPIAASYGLPAAKQAQRYLQHEVIARRAAERLAVSVLSSSSSALTIDDLADKVKARYGLRDMIIHQAIESALNKRSIHIKPGDYHSRGTTPVTAAA